MFSPRIRKAIGMFLLVDFLSSTLAPTVTFALTAGPTAPEATSFEPVDTTDLVNLSSGDFTYNVPLLEVPGPEGGYPLSLAYHAGIQTNEEASWTGLGWSLNPGAITRNVNGYADDHQLITNVVRDYWSGGERQTYNLGVTVGVLNSPASVSFGLAFSQDTYQGFGTGMSFGLGGQLGGKYSSLGAGYTVGEDPYEGLYSGIHAGAGIGTSNSEAARLGANVSVSTNFKSVNVGAGVGISALGNSLLGASITSSGGKPAFSVAGGTATVHNQTAGRISTYSHSSGMDMPTPIPGLSVNLGYSYLRYWSDERTSVATSGSLYYPTEKLPSSAFDNSAYDTYSLLDSKAGIVDYPKPEEVMGGTFPEYDNYVVTAQGLAGTMHPYLLQQNLYRQNKKDQDGNYLVKQYSLSVRSQQVGFRFTGDFSNTFRSGDLAWSSDGDIILPDPTQKGVFENNQLAGSKHIDWFTNNQITNGEARKRGFVDCLASGFSRQSTAELHNQIGGFTITNGSGVNYHYALPAYSYDEEIYTENIEKGDGHTYNQLKKPAKYAYTWFLTALTGPDYVDKNGNGLADEGDWGYWVSFDYGLWASNYQWRNPSEGYHRDLDNNFQSFSKGKKELYYLDAIRTRSHTALFVKEIRNDAKGAVINMQGDGKEAVYTPIVQKNCCRKDNPREQEVCMDTYIYPTSTLRLNKIILFTNASLVKSLVANQLPDLGALKRVSNLYDHSFTRVLDCPRSTDITSNRRVHTGDNILDVGDLPGNLDGNTLRTIILSTDYSLCPNTTNSYASEGIYQATPAAVPSLRTGKLTLNQIKFLGKGGSSADLLPPLRFEYDLPTTEAETVKYQGIGPLRVIYVSQQSKLAVGDILQFSWGNNTYYCLLKTRLPKLSESQSGFVVKFIGNKFNGLIDGLVVRKTKNPPYHKDYYDMWGMYKSDYVQIADNENLSRTVTPFSARNVDAWSLRKIISPLGAVIELDYEPDTYKQPILHKMNQLVVQTIEPLANNQLKVKFYGQPDLSTIFTDLLGKNIFLLAAIGNTYIEIYPEPNSPSGVVENPGCTVEAVNYQPVLKELGDDYLVVEEAALYRKLKTTPPRAGYRDYLSIELFGANIGYAGSSALYGGGIRVADISLVTADHSKHTTSYSYKQANLPTSGVTSYEPSGMDQYRLTYRTGTAGLEGTNAKWEDFVNAGVKQEVDQKYRKELYNLFSTLLANARELPPPGVMYEYVSVEEYVQPAGMASPRKLPGKQVYQFEVFNKGMLGVEAAEATQLAASAGNVDGIKHKGITTRKVALKNYLTRLGALKRIVHYDEQGQKISETQNHYLHDALSKDDQEEVDLTDNIETYEPRLAKYNYQGVVHESFGDAKLVRQKDGTYRLLAVLSKREEYPSILTGVTTIDYKTGLKEENNTLAFDFYSGATTKVLSTDSYGNRFLLESTPAYQLYPGMGLKVGSPHNKHMLSQSTASYSYRVDQKDNPTGLLSATVQTWSNKVPVLGLDQPQNHIWRKHASYTWNGEQELQKDGTFDPKSFVPFNWNDLSANVQWERLGELTLYDIYSHGLEAKDVNDDCAATRMDYRQQRVIATAAPANYHEMAYSGAEYYDGNTEAEGGVNRAEGNPSTAHAHTGRYSLLVGFNSKGFNYTLPIGKENLQKKYRASVWVYAPGEGETQAELEKIDLYYIANGKEVSVSPVLQKNKSKSWYLLTLDMLPEGSGDVYIGCRNNANRGVYFDDFRVHPLGASMASYVYDPFSGELTHILDHNNFYTRFEYDGMGRLIRTSRELLNFDFGDGKESFRADRILSETQYNYGR